MRVEDLYWADSQLEKITIEYDYAQLIIWNDVLQRMLEINCTGFAGMTNLCIWDDTIIRKIDVIPISEPCSEFLLNLYHSYDKSYDYGGRKLCDGLQELRIALVNNISVSVYCLKVEIREHNA